MLKGPGGFLFRRLETMEDTNVEANKARQIAEEAAKNELEATEIKHQQDRERSFNFIRKIGAAASVAAKEGQARGINEAELILEDYKWFVENKKEIPQIFKDWGIDKIPELDTAIETVKKMEA